VCSSDLSTLRLLKAAIKNRQVELRAELSDQEVLGLVSREVKRCAEAEEQFRAGGRPELADKEAAEAVILGAYLPAQLSEAEINEIVGRIVAATGAKGPQDMGKVMQQVMAETRGRADGKLVSGIVRRSLAG